ncbi:Response regulator of zinc sigma-54-dependent two-component system [Minicystis rosea]|nr:Response regulator of zinc sigma-54-dependent two-component system [Minicystis rosea]
MRDPDARGYVLVRTGGAALDALGRHVERRARALGRPLIKVDGTLVDDPWRELAARDLAARMPSPSLPPPSYPGMAKAVSAGDPLAAAQVIVERAGSALIVVRESASTSFGRALSDELARLLQDGQHRCLLLVLTESAVESSSTFFPGNHGSARTIDVDVEIAGDDLSMWWEAVARDAAQRNLPGLDRLDALEAWWSAARVTPLDRRAPALTLSDAATRLLGRMLLSQRSWPVSQIHRLGPTSAAEELVRTGALVLDAGGRLVAGSTMPEALLAIGPVDDADREVVAAVLEDLSDPWAAARASEIHASRGAFDRAEKAAVRAVSSPADASARGDFWRRWEHTLATVPDDEAVPRLLRTADLALRTGDVDRALGLANAALVKRPDTFTTLLTLGRANVARGDLPTATYWLGKALARGTDATARAQVEVELSEVRLMEGDIAGAERCAQTALDALGAGALSTEVAATRLHARNVLGKILLATSAWQKAEQHFAGDACEAALVGDIEGELRARLNRAIAQLSAGRLDDARAMLGSVLTDGEARGQARAVGYALINLLTIAVLRRDYVEALSLTDRTFEVWRRIGDKVRLATTITNISMLKLQLGQVTEAEQALSFGRLACGPGMPGARVSHFAYTAANIHFACGRTAEASSELRVAMATASGSEYGSLHADCQRLAALIALEDGDLTAAAAAIAQVSAHVEKPRDRAWAAVLEASHARASGEPFHDAAAKALEAARACDEPEVLREAHVLSHHAAVLAGDPRAARAHVEAAAATRDRIARTLPEEMRRRYLARRELAELARIEAGCAASLSDPDRSLAPPVADEPEPAVRLEMPRARREQTLPALRRMVGRAPAMLSLATAIQKVGPSDTTVLVHGESGTGKELVAEAIHETSARRAGPLVKVNCAALVETLLLSELFGHEKGSFTGAAARRRGRFEAAEGGTLFLDEIGDISPRTQVALLRVLQDKTFERVGGVTPIRANVRIVCATHRDLAAMVERGEFREDLYYRLRGVVLEVPALRNRIGDLPVICSAILERIAAERGISPRRLSPAALDGLARHGWPGNVRELENALRAAALFAEDDVLELTDFTSNVASLSGLVAVVPPPAPSSHQAGPDSGMYDASEVGPMTQPSKSARSAAAPIDNATGEAATDVAYAAVRGGLSLSDLKRDIERECIARALAEAGGNITRAAGLLGMKRPRLSQLVKQYGFGSGAGADVDAEDGQ